MAIKPSLRMQVLLIAILPTLLLTMIVGGYLLATRISDLRDSQKQIGETIVSHLAPASEYAVISGNQQVLKRLANRLITDSGVKRIRILNSDGIVLAEAASDSVQKDLDGWFSRFRPALGEDLFFTENIYLGDEPLGEFEALFTEDASQMTDPDPVIGKVEVTLSAVPLITRQAEVMRFGIILILTGLLLAWLMAARAGLNIVRPINRVVQAIEDFRKGNLDTRVAIRSRGEAALLERGFNELAAEIQTSRNHMESQIEQATLELRETLEAVEIQNVELDLARKRAEESNRIKSEFLANISHEIRTPMNAIFGYTQLLARTDLQGSQKDYTVTIQRAAESLLALLEDVLNLSRIEAGRVELEETVFDPEELLEDTIAMMAPGIFDQELELIWHPLSPLPREILADAVKIRQVVSNLLSNAGKFTHEGHICLQARVDEHPHGSAMLRIDVIDTGIGIREEDSLRLFKAFSQLDSSSARRHQGAGLGLVICEQLTRLMGGRIDVFSTPGQGSRFQIELPVRIIKAHQIPSAIQRSMAIYCKQALSAQALALRLENLGHEVRILDDLNELASISQQRPVDDDTQTLVVVEVGREELAREEHLERIKENLPENRPILLLVSMLDREQLQFLEQYFGLPCLPKTVATKTLDRSIQANFENLRTIEPSPGGSSSSFAPLANLKILVVEDNRINRHLTVEFLEHAGADTKAAEDGPSALELAESWRPDVVLMDIQLPGMDGLETTTRLQALPWFQSTPVLALTASASEGERRRCVEAGLQDVMVKPLRAEVLVERISRSLRAASEEADEHGGHGTMNGGQTEAAPEEQAPPQPMGRDSDGKLRPEIAAMILDDLPRQVQAAQLHLDRHKLEELDAVVHQIRGTAAFCGFEQLAEHCEAVRASIESGQVDDQTLTALLKRLMDSAEEVLKGLEQD